MALFAIIIALACVFQGIVGFGFALIATPILLAHYDKTIVIPAISLISLAINTTLFFKVKQKVNWRLVATLIGASVLGMPLGIWVLKVVQTSVLKDLMSVFSIFAGLAILFLKLKIDKREIWNWVAGGLSGVLTTSINANAAPITLLLIGRSASPKEFKKTVCVYFLATSVISLIFFSGAKMMAEQSVWHALIAVPGAIGAGILGNKFSERIPRSIHKTIAIVVIVGASAYALMQ